MNEGVKLLVQRMESHPEEFNDLIDGPDKWYWVYRMLNAHRTRKAEKEKADLHEYPPIPVAAGGPPLNVLTDEEYELLSAKLFEARRACIHKNVMQTILHPVTTHGKYPTSGQVEMGF
jgi:hypothetical protein